MKINNNHILPCVNFMRLIFQLKTTPNACPFLNAVVDVINRNQLHVFGEAFFSAFQALTEVIFDAGKWVLWKTDDALFLHHRFGSVEVAHWTVCKNQTLKMEKKQKPNKMLLLLLFLLLRILTTTGRESYRQSSFFTWSEKYSVGNKNLFFLCFTQNEV